VKLAVVLILLIIVLSLLSTLVPQGDSFNPDRYPPGLLKLILVLDFNNFFSSVLFAALAVLFTLNLGVCAVDRFARRLRTKAGKHFGPDLVHLGLLILIAGALLTFAAKRATPDQYHTLSRGDTVQLSTGQRLRLVSYEFQKYASGAPKAWISTVDVLSENGEVETGGFAIRVNHPLRLKGLSVYQASYGNNGSVVMRDAKGVDHPLAVQEGFMLGSSYWYLADIVDDGGFDVAVFQEYTGANLEYASTTKLGKAQDLGGLTIAEIDSRPYTVLKSVRDPGFVPALVALALAAVGLVLTFAWRKRIAAVDPKEDPPAA
jgi:cytochrome c biogenesis protein